VSDILRWIRGAARAGHDVAGQGLHLVLAGSQFKTFGTPFFTEEVNQLGRCLREVPPPISGKVGNFLLSGDLGCFILIDFLLLGYFFQSFYPMDAAICRIN
jgi:hypothetical protein